MIRGTTPDYILTLPGVDLTGETVYVTIAQTARGAARPADLMTGAASMRITKTGTDLAVSSDGTDTTIVFRLSQQETLALQAKQCLIQVRFVDSNGVARATEIKALTVEPILLERVIQYNA